jgi:dTDP-4-amino-4,6-dideoxygalactose transaminase
VKGLDSNFIKVAKPILDNEEIERVVNVLKSGRYVQGPNVKEFEEKFAEYIGVKHAVAVNSGTAALHMALATLGVGPGDEVVVPALTFFSTATSVIHQNAIPVFSDIETTSYNMDPEDLHERITERTRVIIPVHLYGGPAEMDPILELAEKRGVYVVEDAAQAHGAEYKGKKVGSIGHIGCWSFYATKNMTSGEGGMITTDDDEVARKARILRNHGMVNRDDHVMLGYNYRMNEIQAAIGVVQLKKLDIFNEIRIKHSRFLMENLKDVDWFKLPEIRPYNKHVFFWLPVLIDESKLEMSTLELRKRLFNSGVETRHRYNAPLYKQIMLLEKNAYPKGCPFNCPFYGKEMDYSSIYLKNTEKIAGKVLGLPNHPGLEEEDLERVVEVVHEV